MLSREGDQLKVDGPLTIDSVAGVLTASADKLQGVTSVDLSGVTEVDSAAIGLLLEWRRQRSGTDLRFAHLPAALTSLAELYGVVDLIPQ